MPKILSVRVRRASITKKITLQYFVLGLSGSGEHYFNNKISTYFNSAVQIVINLLIN